MVIKWGSTLVLGLVAVAVSACGSDLMTPEKVAGEYALVRVDDARLPVVVAETETRTEEITGGELILFAFAEYTLTVDFRITLETLSGPVVSDSTFIDVGPFRIEGDLIVMQSTRPGVTRFGTLDGSSIVVGLAREGPNLLLTYRR
jgi:hypothetical protein